MSTLREFGLEVLHFKRIICFARIIVPSTFYFSVVVVTTITTVSEITEYRKMCIRDRVTTDQQHTIFQLPFGAAARYQWNRGGAFQPYVSAKLGAEYAKIRSNFSMLEARENSWGFYASPEVGINVFPWVYGPGLHFALYYSYGTNKADVLHYSVDGLSNFGFRLGVSF